MYLIWWIIIIIYFSVLGQEDDFDEITYYHMPIHTFIWIWQHMCLKWCRRPHAICILNILLLGASSPIECGKCSIPVHKFPISVIDFGPHLKYSLPLIKVNLTFPIEMSPSCPYFSVKFSFP